MSLDHARETVEAVLAEQAQRGPAAVVVSLRYVQGSSATLAFTYFPTTCVLEIDGVQSSRTNDFYMRVWDRLERQGIPYTFHWGKQHNLDAARVRRLYGGARGALAGGAPAPAGRRRAAPVLERLLERLAMGGNGHPQTGRTSVAVRATASTQVQLPWQTVCAGLPWPLTALVPAATTLNRRSCSRAIWRRCNH